MLIEVYILNLKENEWLREWHPMRSICLCHFPGLGNFGFGTLEDSASLADGDIAGISSSTCLFFHLFGKKRKDDDIAKKLGS